MKNIKGVELLQLSNSHIKENKLQTAKDKSIEPSSKEKFKETLESTRAERNNQKALKGQAPTKEASPKEQEEALPKLSEENKYEPIYNDLLSILSYLISFEEADVAKDPINSMLPYISEKLSLKGLMEYISNIAPIKAKAETNALITLLDKAPEGESFMEALISKLQTKEEKGANVLLEAITELLADKGFAEEDGAPMKALAAMISQYEPVVSNKGTATEDGEKQLLSQESKTVKIIEKVEASPEKGNNSSLESSKDMKLLEEIISSDKKEPKDAAFNNIINRLQLSNGGIEEKSVAEISSKNSAIDLVKAIKYMEKEGLRELTVRVNPKELGTITIKLIQQGDILKATLRAANEDTHSLLNSRLSEIKALLADSNIKVQEVAISIYNEDTTYFAQGFNEQALNNGSNHEWSREPQKGSELNADELEEELLAPEAEASSTLNTLV